MMTIFRSRSRRAVLEADIVWANPDSMLWVGTVNGDYAGMVEFTAGHFSVRSSTGAIVAECSNIPGAQAALARHIVSPPSIARAAFSPAASRSLFSRTPRPNYLRGHLAAA